MPAPSQAVGPRLNFGAAAIASRQRIRPISDVHAHTLFKVSDQDRPDFTLDAIQDAMRYGSRPDCGPRCCSLVHARLGVAGSLSRTADPAEVGRAIAAIAAGRGYFVETAVAGKAERGPTQRELAVLRLVEEGLKNRAIGERLQTSPRTVEFHLSNVFAKLGATSRTEAVHLARRRGWLD